MAGLIQQAQQPQQGGRKASQMEQKQFELAVKQASEFLMQDENIDALVDMVKKSGPAKAIALFVKKILDGVYTAAGNSGVKVGGHTMSAAAEIVCNLAATILVKGGVKADPKQLVAQAMQEMERV